MGAPRQDKERIHQEYISTDISIRQLAAKYNVGASTINRWIAADGWSVEKRYYLVEAARRAREELAGDRDQYMSALISRNKSLVNSADKLLAKVDALLDLEDALCPKDLKSLSSTLLDIKMLHDVGRDDEPGKNDVCVKLAGDLAAFAD